jgi:hypothetical protein
MSASPPKPDIRLVLVKRSASDPKQTLIKSDHTMAHSLDISWNRDSAEGGAAIDFWLDPEQHLFLILTIGGAQ